MKLSTKAQHAVTAMINLAMNSGVRPVTLAEISKNQGISLSYLEQLFSKMRKAGLVEGVRGPGGGYKLASASQNISIADIIVSIDGSEHALAAVGDINACSCENSVDTQDQDHNLHITNVMWRVLSDRIYKFLSQLTLAEFSDVSVLRNLTMDSETINEPELVQYKDMSGASV